MTHQTRHTDETLTNDKSERINFKRSFADVYNFTLTRRTSDMVDLLQPVNFRLSRVFVLFQYLVLITFCTIYFVFYLLPVFRRSIANVGRIKHAR